MRPEPRWLYTLRNSVGLQAVLMTIGTVVVTWTMVTMLDAAAGVDKYGAPLANACTPAGSAR